MNTILRSACETHNVRVTMVRKNLFDLLVYESPVSVSSFFEITKKRGFDTVSVYRTLDFFRKLEIVHEHGVGRQRILQAKTELDAHHHFITCESCGFSQEFEDDAIEFQLSTVAAENGFPNIHSHYLEIIGTCKNCYSATA